jgi:ankyrin repeat protein
MDLLNDEHEPLLHDDTLIDCSVKDQVELCRAKLEAGSDPNSANRVGQTALHVAAIWGSLGVARLLIKAGANVEARNELGGVTPLMFAAQRGQAAFAKMLLESGANRNTKDESGRVAYMFATDDELRELLGGPSGKLIAAVRGGKVAEVAEVVRSYPHLLVCEDGEGNTAMTVAIQQDKWEVAHWLASQADASRYVNQRGAAGDAPLHLAARAGRLELLNALLKAGAEPDLKSRRLNEYTRGNYDRLDPDSGKKVAVSSEHRTALFECAERGDVAVARALIESGCDLDATDGDGCTALYEAVDGDEREFCELLLAAGASPDIGNADIGKDNTLLAWAASRRRLDLVELFLKHGADPNKPGKSGLYPLHMAARSGDKAILVELLAKGADPTRTCVTFKGCPGATARQMVEKNPQAVANGCLEVVPG